MSANVKIGNDILNNVTAIKLKNATSGQPDVSFPYVSGNINITSTSSTDVTNYATAQVVDANLVANNIKSGTTILGVTGSYSGGGLSASGYTLTITPEVDGNYCYRDSSNQWRTGSFTSGTNVTLSNVVAFSFDGTSAAVPGCSFDALVYLTVANSITNNRIQSFYFFQRTANYVNIHPEMANGDIFILTADCSVDIWDDD